MRNRDNGNDRSENRARAKVRADQHKKQKMEDLIREIQIYTLIQGKELAKRLSELSVLLEQSEGNSEYVSKELIELSKKLVQLAEKGGD